VLKKKKKKKKKKGFWGENFKERGSGKGGGAEMEDFRNPTITKC